MGGTNDYERTSLEIGSEGHMTTLKEIAERVGVSISTVSRVINQNDVITSYSIHYTKLYEISLR